MSVLARQAVTSNVMVLLQCTITGARTSTGPEDPKKTRLQWMLDAGVFPPWRVPDGNDAPPSTVTTYTNPQAGAVAGGILRSDQGATSPEKSALTPDLGQVTVLSHAILP